MSDKPCNYCILRRLRARAKAQGLKVTVRPGRYVDALGAGHSVYLHPKDREPDTSEGSPDFSAWFMALSKSCCC